MRKVWLISAIAITLFSSCKRVPKDIIQPDDMASLMADMRLASAVVNIEAPSYRTDDSREALKRAVLDRHGVSEEQFDHSLMWYGHNITLYQEMTDKSVEILQSRLNDAGAEVTHSTVTMGDSSDVWQLPRVYSIDSRFPADYISFSLPTEPEQGYIYTWQARLAVPPADAVWNITAEYTDGSVEYVNSLMSPHNPASQRLSLYTDSTRTLHHVSGWLKVRNASRMPVVIDSLALTRRKYENGMYGRRVQRFIPSSSDVDSTSRN